MAYKLSKTVNLICIFFSNLSGMVVYEVEAGSQWIFTTGCGFFMFGAFGFILPELEDLS